MVTRVGRPLFLVVTPHPIGGAKASPKF